MEAVNKVINTASNAIWGEGSTQTQNTASQEHDEPISGVQGKGDASDPYDAGNRDEQPDAPATDANTAPQDPKLDGQPKNASSADAVTGSTTNPAVAGSSSSNTTSTPASSSADSSSAADSAPKSVSENKEQRGAQSGGDRVQAVMEEHQVSKEALQGPQGPAPKAAEEFEKDMSKASKDLEEKEAAAASKGDTAHHDGNRKTSPMSKMKETLNKVAHPRHGGKQ